MKNILHFTMAMFLAIIPNGCKENGNRVEVFVSDGMSMERVEIQMEVLADSPRKDVFSNNQYFDVPNGYGENEWYFVYGDRFKGHLRHFKTNRNDQHRYMFYFHKRDDKFYVKAEIFGLDSLKKTVQLTEL